MDKVIALVPMKGHSERVSNKNIRDFDGQPLFFRILDTLTKAKCIKSIYIDTDSDEIARLALENFDVNIIKRPEKLIGDYVSMNEIIKYDLTQITDEYFIQTHATNPLLKAETIDNAVNTYLDSTSKNDSLFSVTRLQTRLYDQYLNPINHNPEVLMRTQDLPPVYEENSNFYIFSKQGFHRINRRIGEKPMFYEVEKDEALDIDEEIDFIIAENLYKMKNTKQESK